MSKLNGNWPPHRARHLLGVLPPALPAVALSASLAAEPPEPTPNAASALGPTNSVAAAVQPADIRKQNWNLHAQSTGVLQADSGFPAKYSGPNSLNSKGEIQETVSLDIFAGVRLWSGAEAHIDGLVWQGFGLSKTLGVEAFPSSEAYRLGTHAPNTTVARLFLRQTINLGGDEQSVEDGQLQLAGKQDTRHLTFTVGEISLLDIFDNNTYAHDPTTQFMNWAFVGNEAWDYPANSLGYETGFAVELYEPGWALRYGMFQMPDVSNGMAQDAHYLDAWGMVTEFERDYTWNGHHGAVRFLGYLNRAHMGSYSDALSVPGIDITQTRAYRLKYGLALNWEQEITANIGVFSRIGWSDGHTEAWVYADVDRSASAGTSIKGAIWGRPNDTYGLAAVISGITKIHQEFLAAGGTGILAGDGALTYGLETAMETYYDFQVWKSVRLAFDYQFVVNPAYNRDRGPVSIFGGRLHWEF